MRGIDRVIEETRRAHRLDRRSSVFEIHHSARDGIAVLTGHTTEDHVAVDLVERVKGVRGVHQVIDEIIRLPGHLSGQNSALVRAAVAPVYEEPRVPAPQITQIVLGSRVDLLSQQALWWRIRSEDGYIGWVHSGYLAQGTVDWARSWERGATGESFVSLGAELLDDDGRSLSRLPWGARLIRYSHDVYELPDGRRGSLGEGEVIAMDRLFDRFPPRGDSVTRTARRWLGVSYLWGGVTMGGVDCSGLTQVVLWMHGVALPRDSDLQGRVGQQVVPGETFAQLRSGDLLFFAETPERISHVAISLGESRIVHSALSNGGVAMNDLLGDTDFEKRLRGLFVSARRLLPD